MTKVTSLKELLTQANLPTICKVFCQYANQYTDKITNVSSVESDDTPYKQGLINCKEVDYATMSQLFQNEGIDIEYAIDNNEFLQFMIKMSNMDMYDDSITQKLRDKVKSETDYVTIDNKEELADIQDNVNDKYRVENKKFYKNTAVLYINGEVLTGDTMHINLLMKYLDNYSKYTHIKDLSKIKNKIKDWDDLEYYHIPAIRLYKYDFGNICEYLSSYGINNLDSHIKTVAKKLHCKIYQFFAENNIDMRIAKKTRILGKRLS